MLSFSYTQRPDRKGTESCLPPYSYILYQSYTQRPDRKGTESNHLHSTHSANPSVTLKDPIERGLKDQRTLLPDNNVAVGVTLKDPIERGLKDEICKLTIENTNYSYTQRPDRKGTGKISHAF